MDLLRAKRIVIKIGSALLVDQATGKLKSEWLASLAEDIAYLQSQDKEVVIVTSGAVALGKKYINTPHKSLKLEQKQAAAACGQIELLKDYQQHLAQHQIPVAQILITIEDTENRRRYLNARATLRTLLDDNIIPIINENDTVATPELRFGDNDRLAARVAQLIEADVLVLLSDIDGLYTANPHQVKEAEFIAEVHEITDKIRQMAGGVSSGVGSGGMITKIAAAEIATRGGCHMVITKGHGLHPLKSLMEGARSTWFFADSTPQKARKHWIATSLLPSGSIIIDDGAVVALKNGKSLLPAGVVRVEGHFERGDAVVITASDGAKVAKGLCNFSSDDAKRIVGKKTSDVEATLGYAGRTELVHRDELVML